MKQSKRTSATLNGVAEEKMNVRCVDDVTGKELPCSAVRRTREEEQEFIKLDTRQCTRLSKIRDEKLSTHRRLPLTFRGS